jgi:aspartate/methionine/tyrosine aminotransferase
VSGFVPPPYPYERLDAMRAICERHEGGIIDCSIGDPSDPPAPAVVAALAGSDAERSYPPSAGMASLRAAMVDWLARRFGVALEPSQLAACVGTKEFVASTAHYLHLRQPERSVVLYPAVSYPTYAMGAMLAGLEAHPVPMAAGRLMLEAVPEEVAARALVLWSNSPSNPTGGLDDLEAVAAWGRARGIPVLSDECYADFTWEGPPRSILQSGTEGVVAVHSLSKRSNLAGVRCGFYAGDAELVEYLRVVRQHAGLMVPGPVQRAAEVAYGDDASVEEQRRRYFERLEAAVDAFRAAGYQASMPEGAFYLWLRVPEQLEDGWAFAADLADRTGILVSPGDLYGPDGADHVRLAAVQPLEVLRRGLDRL